MNIVIAKITDVMVGFKSHNGVVVVVNYQSTIGFDNSFSFSVRNSKEVWHLKRLLDYTGTSEENFFALVGKEIGVLEGEIYKGFGNPKQDRFCLLDSSMVSECNEQQIRRMLG